MTKLVNRDALSVGHQAGGSGVKVHEVEFHDRIEQGRDASAGAWSEASCRDSDRGAAFGPIRASFIKNCALGKGSGTARWRHLHGCDLISAGAADVEDLQSL